MGDWTDEVDLQRRALYLTASKSSGGDGLAAVTRALGAGQGWAARVPLWAQVSRVQALQSLALKAPRDKDLRAALYEVNITQVCVTGTIIIVLRSQGYAREMRCAGVGRYVGFENTRYSGSTGRRGERSSDQAMRGGEGA